MERSCNDFGKPTIYSPTVGDRREFDVNTAYSSTPVELTVMGYRRGAR